MPNVIVVVFAGVGYVLVNLGSKDKVSFAQIALPLAIIALVVMLAWPAIAPFADWLMSIGSRLH